MDLISFDVECLPPSTGVNTVPSQPSIQDGSLYDSPRLFLPRTPAPNARKSTEHFSQPAPIDGLDTNLYSTALLPTPTKVDTTFTPLLSFDLAASPGSWPFDSSVSPESTANLLRSPVPGTLYEPLIDLSPVDTPVCLTPCGSSVSVSPVSSAPPLLPAEPSSRSLIIPREAPLSVTDFKGRSKNTSTKDTSESVLGLPLVPRLYQQHMYEKALHENIIAVMDTGSGKTLVAAMLIKETVRQEGEVRRNSSEKKISVFVVANVPLVRQQANAIRRDSGATVVEISGNKAHKLPESDWAQMAEEAQVVVVTAQILLDALRQGYWNMNRINVLVFDECHHAHKTHPYSLIMNEFYHTTPVNLKAQLPRIFGMTASLTTETGLRLDHSATKLQRLLDCRVYTVATEDLKVHGEKPQQFVTMYNPPPKYNPTRLTRHLHGICRFEDGLQTILNNTSTMLPQLGPWCVDQLWRQTVENMSISDSRISVGVSEKLNRAKSKVSRWEFTLPELRNEHLTPKVQKLIQILRVTAKLFKEEFCGIVFVQRRDTAAALTMMLQEYEPFREIFQVKVLAGHRDRKDLVLRTSAAEQSITISMFQDGAYNLLVSTCVAEEGLDIQPCNVVIQFDPVTTTTSYIQSRGRARKSNSRYFMMQERIPEEHVRDLEDTALVPHHRGEQLLRDWCRKRDIESFCNDSQIHESTPAGVSHLERIYRIPSTQAVLTLDSAIPLLSRFCILSAQKELADRKPVFDVFPSDCSFSCVLTLPPNKAVRVVQSDRTATKDLARMHAAFKACQALHKAGALDDHLEPVVAKSAAKDTAPRFKLDQTNPYPHNTPSFWTSGLPNSAMGSQKVFLCTIVLEDISAWDALHHQPMYLIISGRLPFSKHSFNVYIRGEVHRLTLTASNSPLVLSGKQLGLLRQYTLKLFERIMKKKVECLDDMPFMLAPISDIDAFDQTINWNEIEMGLTLEPKPIEMISQTDEEIKDMVVTVENQHTCDYFIAHVMREHQLNDIMPAIRFKKEVEDWRTGLGGDHRDPTFRQYFLWKFKVECNNNEVMLQTRQIYRFRNHLQSDLCAQKEPALVLLPLSICCQSTATASVLRMAQLVPSVIFDLDELLLAQEARQKLHLSLSVKLDILQEALTTGATQRLYNYQRLELLGDSFLKLSSSACLYIVEPTMTEGQLHSQRVEIISNDALREHALRLELFRYVANGKFQRRTWKPVKFVVDGKVKATEEEHLLSNKTLADIVESTMGAALLSGGIESAFACAKALGIPFSEFNTWADLERICSDQAQDSEDHAEDRIAREAFQDRLHGMETLLHYTFQHPSLAQEAMTHSSTVAHSDCAFNYQRLEFLGDAVLDFLVVSYYYKKYPNAPPGAIALIKDSSVNNQILGAMAVEWGLGEFLIHMSESLAREIQRVIVEIEAINEKSESGELQGEYWIDLNMSKVLGDVVESMLGAVFVDCGFSIARITELFEHLIRPFLDKHVDPDRIAVHAVKYLLEYLQAQGCNDSRLEQVDEGGVKRLRKLGISRDPIALSYRYVVHGSVVASGSGLSRKDVRKQVAVEAMQRLKLEPGLLESLCSCAKRKKQQVQRGTMLDKDQQAHSPMSLMV
ncbi:Dicer-like protein 1 [Podila epicladia]|nr:Dicer-like protein 1 [Podila epicladia]KAG0095767.1 Dicer-like protein 1 [Podila epicladia]